LSGGVQASEELAKKHNCLACHKTDAKLVGPSYKDVAAKYKAEDMGKLIEKVKKGGSGAWGQIPMPPNPAVSDDDLKTLVTWILSIK
jgi:cytochrome c